MVWGAAQRGPLYLGSQPSPYCYNRRCISLCPGEHPWAPGVQAGPQGAWESGTVSRSRGNPSMLAEGHM